MQLADILNDIYQGRSAQGAIVSDEGVRVEVETIDRFHVEYPDGIRETWQRVTPFESHVFETVPQRSGAGLRCK